MQHTQPATTPPQPPFSDRLDVALMTLGNNSLFLQGSHGNRVPPPLMYTRRLDGEHHSGPTGHPRSCAVEDGLQEPHVHSEPLNADTPGLSALQRSLQVHSHCTHWSEEASTCLKKRTRQPQGAAHENNSPDTSLPLLSQLWT